jgi:hypothetical protein
MRDFLFVWLWVASLVACVFALGSYFFADYDWRRHMDDSKGYIKGSEISSVLALDVARHLIFQTQSGSVRQR